MRFEFATAPRIVFGAGTLCEVAPLAAGLGKRALVVTTKNLDRVAALLEQLHEHAIETRTLIVDGEPTTALIAEGIRFARDAHCDMLIGAGGGSVIDTGKAIAAMLTNPGDLLDYLEVIGKGKSLTQPSAPYIAIPTTAGTGSEVTRNAVLVSPAHKVKVSLRSPFMLPRVAVVDPELTYSLPPAVTASTGVDALTQLIEPYVCNAPNPMTDAICREGMQRSVRALKRAYVDGQDAAAREDAALASLFGGIALANAKLGAVHGFAAVLGGMFPAPHGVICARLLPIVTETNVRALQSRVPGSSMLTRYVQVAQILTNNPSATIADGIEWLQALCADLSIPPLSHFGVTRSDFPQIIEQAQIASSMKGNPIVLTEQELDAILSRAL